jgi:quinol monooxygenase YgiN
MSDYVMIPFKVQEDKLEEAKQTINELIKNVKENEPGTLLYNSLQSKQDPTTFVHFIVFADNDAHLKHRSAIYVMDFVKKIYEMCPDEPHPVFLDSFDSCGIAMDTLAEK